MTGPSVFRLIAMRRFSRAFDGVEVALADVRVNGVCEVFRG